jgi:hypothetical protein
MISSSAEKRLFLKTVSREAPTVWQAMLSSRGSSEGEIAADG